MRDTTKQAIIAHAATRLTFYGNIADLLSVKGVTADRYLKLLVKAGILTTNDDGVHAVTYDLSSDARAGYLGAQAMARAIKDRAST